MQFFEIHRVIQEEGLYVYNMHNIEEHFSISIATVRSRDGLVNYKYKRKREFMTTNQDVGRSGSRYNCHKLRSKWIIWCKNGMLLCYKGLNQIQMISNQSIDVKPICYVRHLVDLGYKD
jgi:hypothetical protein